MTEPLEPGIYAFLSEAGLLVDDRVYPLTMPQNVTLPAITFQLVAETPFPTHDWQQDHPLHTGRRHEEARVQFNAYGNTYDEAVAVSNQLKSAITGYRGLWGEVQIQSVLPALSLDDYEPDTGLWRRITDFYIGWIAGVAGS